MYLTWTKLLVGSHNALPPYGNLSAGPEMILTRIISSSDVLISLYDVNASDWTGKHSKKCLPVKSKGEWWVEEDLNLRPHAYQACALTT